MKKNRRNRHLTSGQISKLFPHDYFIRIDQQGRERQVPSAAKYPFQANRLPPEWCSIWKEDG